MLVTGTLFWIMIWLWLGCRVLRNAKNKAEGKPKEYPTNFYADKQGKSGKKG